VSRVHRFLDSGIIGGPPWTSSHDDGDADRRRDGEENA
jgi:hypothetical protein